MNIEQIDKNFRAEKIDDKKDREVYLLPCKPFDLYGVYYDNDNQRFARMSFDVANQVSKELGVLSSNTSGGRLRFSTDSKFLDIRVEYRQLSLLPHMPLVGSGGFMLLEETENGFTPAIRMMTPYGHDKNGYTAKVTLEGEKLRNYILFFPLYNDVDKLEIGVEAGATVAAGKKYRDILPILYYGSSITQGACASRPDNAYPSQISKWNNVDFVNMGFSGLARGEPMMADYLSRIPCSVFVCDYDYNAFDVGYLQATHYPFYQTYRKNNPRTPILFITKPDIDRDPFGEARKKVVYHSYLKAKRAGDDNVYFLSGKSLYGKADRASCSVDGCHPNDLGFYRMAKRVYQALVAIDSRLK